MSERTPEEHPVTPEPIPPQPEPKTPEPEGEEKDEPRPAATKGGQTVMKSLLFAGAAAATLALGISNANAIPIAAGSELSLNGSDTFTATATTFTINFTNPANLGGTSGSFATALGVVPPQVVGVATMIATLMDTSTNFQLYSVTNNGATSTLTAGTISAFQFTGGAIPALDIQGTGTLSLTGFDTTAGAFTITTQGPNSADVTFSNTSVATGVPEPASLALLGTALLLLGGLWQWRRN